MKLSRWEAGILMLSALFLAFTAGWFLRGSGSSEPLRVETQRQLGQAAAALSSAAVEPTEAPKKVNINTADLQALQSLPGIGEKRAADIIADRERNGPYRFPEDVTRVKGIGEETLEKLIEYITTEDES